MRPEDEFCSQPTQVNQNPNPARFDWGLDTVCIGLICIPQRSPRAPPASRLLIGAQIQLELPRPKSTARLFIGAIPSLILVWPILGWIWSVLFRANIWPNRNMGQAWTTLCSLYFVLCTTLYNQDRRKKACLQPNPDDKYSLMQRENVMESALLLQERTWIQHSYPSPVTLKFSLWRKTDSDFFF